MTQRTYIARLATAIGLLVFIAACSAALDFGSLSTEPPPDGGAKDVGVGSDADAGYQDQFIPADLPPPIGDGPCNAGQACQVPGKQGICGMGVVECNGAQKTCKQVFQPSANETCDGRDEDCNGASDRFDDRAHADCGDNRYCAGNTCAAGCARNGDCTNGNGCLIADNRCVCGQFNGCTGFFKCVKERCSCGSNDLVCSPGEFCTSTGRCACGNQTSDTGPICTTARAPRCINNTRCACDGNSTCGPNERCVSGRCNCGATQGPLAGPFCPQGTCNAAMGACVGVPDIGVDAPPPDIGVDAPPPDRGVPDQPVPDQAQPDQPVVQPDAAGD